MSQNLCSECEYFSSCPVGFKRSFFELDEVYFNCEELNKFFDALLEIKRLRVEFKQKKEEEEQDGGFKY